MAKSTAFAFGLAALCASVVLVTFRAHVHRSSLESLPAKHTSDFQAVWDAWLGRVNREVKAAIDISGGLSPKKKETMNNLLSKDLSEDFQTSETVVKTLDEKYNDEIPKAVHTAAPKPQAKKSIVSPRKSVVAVVPKVTNHGKGKVVAKAAHILKQTAKPAPLPFNKALAAKIAADDRKVAIAEKQAHLAASHLKLEAAHPAKRNPAAAAAAAAPASFGWQAAAAASLATTSQAAGMAAGMAAPRRVRAARRHARPGPASLAARIQSALRTEMKRNRGDAGLAREMTKEEERSWNRELRKWGLAS